MLEPTSIYPPAAVQHVLCPTHLFCRLRDEGMDRDEAMDWARRSEAWVGPLLYPHRVTGCQPTEE